MDKKQDSFFLRTKKHQVNNKKVDKQNSKPFEKEKEKRQKNFDSNRPVKDKKDDVEKKPFDKKAYRLKKYSKKYKLEQWEEKRKKKLLYDYHKSIKNDAMLGSYTPKSFDEDTIDNNPPEVGKFVRHPDLIEKENAKVPQKTNKDPFQKAKEHYEKLKLDKLQKQQELQKSKEEKLQKIQEYKKKKQERFKKLSKKTKKGQPVMTGRLELLLEKIQK